MILTCPECTTTYSIPDGTVRPEGRKVKCQKCAHTWIATPEPDPASATTPAAQADAGDFDAAPAVTAEAMVDDAADSEWAAAVSEQASNGGAAHNVTSGSVTAHDEMTTTAAAFEAVVIDHADAIDDLDFGLIDDEAEYDDEPPRAGVDVESQAGRRGPKIAAPGEKSRSAGRVPGGGSRAIKKVVALAACLALAAGSLVYFRGAVVRTLPGTAHLFAAAGYPVNLRGLEFRDVSFENLTENGVPVLAIRGHVVNITGKQLTVPELRFSLRDTMQQEIYHWTARPDQRDVAPAGRTGFKTRLASPPSGVEQVQIRFAGRRP